MHSTTLLEIEPTTSCPPVAIWRLPAFWLDDKTSSASNDLEPVQPQVAVVEWIALEKFKGRIAQPEGEPLMLPIALAEVRAEKIAAAPVAREQHIARPAYYTKPGHACEPAASGMSAIKVAPEVARSQTSALPLPAPVISEPRTETEAWRATALKPSEPSSGESWPVVFRAQPGGFAAVRQKQVLRELVLPSARPWYSLAVLWESINGFHFAMPTAEEKAQVGLPFPNRLELWNDSADADLPGRRFLEQAEEMVKEPQPSLEGARTFLAQSRIREAATPFVPGLKEPYSIRKTLDEAEPVPQASVPEILPHAVAPEELLPDVALPEGLTIWTGVTNSYRRRFWSLPRLREGGRMVNMLQLAPSMEWSEPAETSA